MRRSIRVVATGLLVSLTAGLVVGIVMLRDWGGHIEMLMLVFGDQVWLKLDVGRPRFLLLLLVPGVFLAAAFSLRAWRRDE